MKITLDNVYAGFIVQKITDLPDINAVGYELEHEISGAKLLYIATEDDNKVFTIGFPTPSIDDTGVAHITEHSVLCGSRKYPLKEPFVELVKGSLNTFLNAMTYSDKTVYPVASRNAKDFQNLMDVYLDAVFYPNIYANSFTLAQEGWHYEIEKPEGDLTYNGVVYNEMKGVYSTPDAVEEHEVYKALFPNSPYRFESGGLPDAIPTLTQEMFLSFHKNHYCPENSFIYLYGDMDIEKTLNYLDTEYLSHFPKTGNIKFTVDLQQAFLKTKEVEATYSLPQGESTQGKTFLSMNIVTGTALTAKRALALKILNNVLLEGNDAPLRLALLKANIGNDISGSFATSMLQPIFNIRASGSEPEKLDEFVKVIYSTLQDITRQGIDKALLTAQINSFEFKLREGDFGVYPKGLLYGLSCYDTWLYGGDPLISLKFTELIDSLRKQAEGSYFEKLIETYLLDNTHKALVVLKPEPGKEEAKAMLDAHKMQQLKAHMSTQEIEKYCQLAQELHERQGAEDTPEALATIPVLERSDIRKNIENENYELSTEGKSKILYLPQATNKIVYLNWRYDVTGIEPENMPYMYLFTDMLAKVNTKDFTYQELATYATTYTGGMSFNMKVEHGNDDMSVYGIKFTLDAKVMSNNLDKLFKLLHNLALTSDFTDKARLKEIVAEIKTDWDNNFFARGQSVAISRLYSYFSPAARVTEQDQLSYYNFLQNIWEHFDEKIATIIQKMQEISANFFHSEDQLFAFSCEEQDKDAVLAQNALYTASLGQSKWAGKKAILMQATAFNEGVTTSGKVQYVVAGGNFRAHGYAYTGAMQVLETILRYGYLWTKIRVQGGAYGANAHFELMGYTVFSSYRDPNLVESLEAYKGLPEYLSSFEASEREMTKYVIGTMSGVDITLTNSMHLDRAISLYNNNLAPEVRQQYRNEILTVSCADIRALAPLVKDVLADNYFCVVGSENKILAHKDIFTSIKRV